MAGFEDAVAELSQVPLPQFVDERKRIAGELKAAGDAAGAKQVLARKRPTISVWVVNQLYWHARDAFENLLATAERLRKGDLKASGAHRDAIAKLRARAKTMLEDAGNAPTESTLRRVATTLAAIAVTGGFDPDPPGALSEDRDPPGFAAFGIASGSDEPAAPAPAKPAAKAKPEKAKKTKADDEDDKKAKHPKSDDTDDLAKARARRAREAESAKAREAEERKEEHEREQAEKEAEKAREAKEAAQRAADMAEKEREEAEKKRITAERHRLEAAIRSAKAELADRILEVKQLEKQLAAATKAIEKAKEIVDDLVRKRDDLRADD